jgi:putative ATPase
LYSHEFPENVSGQQYLEKPLDLYLPKSAGAEAAVTERLQRWKEIRSEISSKKDD